MNHVGYVILHHGPRHSSLPLEKRPGAQSQMACISRLANSLATEVSRWRFDHARAPSGPGSLPVLFALLAFAREHDANGYIVVDDVSRLFRRLGVDEQMELLGAIEPFHRHVLDAKRRKPLSDLKQAEWMAALLAARGSAVASNGHANASPGSRNAERTERARRISGIARGRQADRLAQQIFALRSELIADGKRISNAGLARSGNE